MSTHDVLNQLQQEIQEVGLDCTIIEVEGVPHLFVYTGSDDHRRGQHLDITAQEVNLEQLFTPEAENSINYLRLEFYAPFAFPVEDLLLADMAQFLHFINTQIQLPGFSLDFLENKVFYRYVLFCEGQQVPKKLVLNILGLILFFYDAFKGSVEQLALGKTSFIQLLEDIQRKINKFTYKIQ